MSGASNPHVKLEVLEFVAQMMANKRREKITRPFVELPHQQRPPVEYPYRYWLFMAGRGCFSIDTDIYVVGEGYVKASDLVKRNEPITVLSMTPDGIRPRPATAPFRKGYAPLYRVMMPSGHSMDVTGFHRFMTDSGWKLAQDLTSDDLLTVLHEDDLRSLQTPRDFQSNCSARYHQCDSQLLLGPVGARYVPRQRGDACGHTHSCSQQGGQGHGSGGNENNCRSSQHKSHLSRSGFSPDVQQAEALVCCGVPFRCEPFRQTLQDASQSPLLTCPRSAYHESFECQPVFSHALSRHDLDYVFLPLAREGSELPSCMCSQMFSQCLPHAHHLGIGGQSLFRDQQEVSCDPSIDLSIHNIAKQLDYIKWERVRSIECIGEDYYYDLTVQADDAANYLANGLFSHNSGKTRTGTEFVMDHLRALGRRANVGVMAPTHHDAVQICFEGLSGIHTNYFHEFESYHKSNRILTHKDGGRVQAIGSEKEGRWRGHNWTLIWVDELAQCHQPSVDHAILGLRVPFDDIDTSEYNVPNRPVLIATTTPLPIPRIVEWASDDFKACYVTRASTFDNAANLDEATLQSYIDMYGDTTLGRQELYAEILDKIEGARWTFEMIESTRLKEIPQVVIDSENTELVIAIDPAASSGGDADKSAITAVLKGYPHEKTARRGLGPAHYYILDAWAAHATPYTWSKKALQMYLDYKADRIIGEKNNGGEMVQYTIESTIERMRMDGEWPRGDLIPRIKLVHASRGKVARTDPVIALYEQSRVSHVGIFPVLETEMTRYPIANEFMDPIDSLTWGISALADLHVPQWRAI